STVAQFEGYAYPWKAVAPAALPPPVQSDQAALSYPWQVELDRRVDQGTLPFWQHGTFLGGYPLYSNANSAQLYPPHLIPALLGLDPVTSHDLFAMVHLFLA